MDDRGLHLWFLIRVRTPEPLLLCGFCRPSLISPPRGRKLKAALVHVDSIAAKVNALEAKERPLVKSCLAAKQNPPSASQHAMPGQVLKVVYTQSPGNLTGSPRVACAARHFPVSGDLAPRNAPNGALNVGEIRHDFTALGVR
jgi:hypothetical protein